MRRRGGLLTLAVLCALPVPHATADEPVRASIGWGAPAGFREVAFPLTLEKDAGDADAAWLTGFSFAASEARGTIGLTTSARGGGSYVVQVVGATSSSAGRDAVCTTVQDSSRTDTCTLTTRPVEGHAYELLAERQVTSAWVFGVRDLTDETLVVLGSFGVGGTRDMTADGWSGTEQGACDDDAPVTRALFGAPRTSVGTAAFAETSTRTACPGTVVRVTSQGARVVTGPPAAGTETPTPLELPTSAPQPTAPAPTPVRVRTQAPQPVTASAPPSPAATTGPAVALPRSTVSGTSSSDPTPVAAPRRSDERSGRDLPWWLPFLLVPVVFLPVRRRSGHL